MTVLPKLAGGHLIAGRHSQTKDGGGVSPQNAHTGERLPVFYPDWSAAELEQATSTAARSLPTLRDQQTRAELLKRIAHCLDEDRPHILAIAQFESELGIERLTNEFDRMLGQLRRGVAAIEEGVVAEAILDVTSDEPVSPGVNLRRVMHPVGPVAIFESSNFPLALGTAGSDTCAALAAGCPVIVKAHPAHPGTSELCGRAIVRAGKHLGLDPGFFSLMYAADASVSVKLVTAPEVAAVSFTGSFTGGMAISHAASERVIPIPVYAEMGSLNPVYLTAKVVAERGAQIVASLSNSITQNAGQFCTKPGVIVVPSTSEGDDFVKDLAEAVGRVEVSCMLHRALKDKLEAQLTRAVSRTGLRPLTASRRTDPHPGAVSPQLLATSAAEVIERPALLSEFFGPVAVVLTYNTEGELVELARALPAGLTATVHSRDEDLNLVKTLQAVLETRAGRLVFDQFPTGGAPVYAMHHGGPYPATTSAGHTSVGMMGVRRFQRPVTYQNCPESLLPVELQDINVSGIQRLVNGQWTSDSLSVRPVS